MQAKPAGTPGRMPSQPSSLPTNSSCAAAVLQDLAHRARRQAWGYSGTDTWPAIQIAQSENSQCAVFLDRMAMREARLQVQAFQVGGHAPHLIERSGATCRWASAPAPRGCVSTTLSGCVRSQWYRRCKASASAAIGSAMICKPPGWRWKAWGLASVAKAPASAPDGLARARGNAEPGAARRRPVRPRAGALLRLQQLRFELARSAQGQRGVQFSLGGQLGHHHVQGPRAGPSLRPRWPTRPGSHAVSGWAESPGWPARGHGGARWPRHGHPAPSFRTAPHPARRG